jgi:hypothetical protein
MFQPTVRNSIRFTIAVLLGATVLIAAGAMRSVS